MDSEIMEYSMLAGLWILWCAIHSGLIALRVTEALQGRFGPGYRYYRLLYNAVSLGTLIPLIVYSNRIRNHTIMVWEGNLVILRIVLIGVMVFLFVAGFRHYDFLQFLGIRQVMTGSAHGSLSDENAIETKGILGVTRHPWYLAMILFVWVYFNTMYLSTLIISSILTAYLIIGTILEERKLVKEYGDAYRNYQVEVSMIFPFRWIGSCVWKR